MSCLLFVYSVGDVSCCVALSHVWIAGFSYLAVVMFSSALCVHMLPVCAVSVLLWCSKCGLHAGSGVSAADGWHEGI